MGDQETSGYVYNVHLSFVSLTELNLKRIAQDLLWKFTYLFSSRRNAHVQGFTLCQNDNQQSCLKCSTTRKKYQSIRQTIELTRQGCTFTA